MMGRRDSRYRTFFRNGTAETKGVGLETVSHLNFFDPIQLYPRKLMYT